jgi:hypothetical protein
MARMLTLTGAGGCDKTRLALHAAAGLADRCPDGARWVELAPLADPALVPNAVAAALSVREAPGRPPGGGPLAAPLAAYAAVRLFADGPEGRRPPGIRAAPSLFPPAA